MFTMVTVSAHSLLHHKQKAFKHERDLNYFILVVLCEETMISTVIRMRGILYFLNKRAPESVLLAH